MLKSKTRFGKALAWSAVGEWGRQLVAFVVFGVIARVVAPAAFGLVAMAGAFVLLGQVLVDQGLSDAIIQRRELEKGHLDTAFWLTLVVAILLAAAGVLVARPLAYWFKQPALIPVLSWMLLALPLGALASIQQAILRRSMDFRALAIRSLGATAVGGIVGIVLAIKGYGEWALVAQTLVTSAVGVALLWTVSDWRPGLAVSRSHLRELISFGWHIGGASLLSFVSRRSDDLIIGFFLGPVALGYYTMAYRVLELTQAAFINITVTVSYPAIAKVQSEPPRVASMFLELTQFMSLVAFPVAVGMSLTAPELVATAFGGQWGPSGHVLRVLAFAVIIIALFIFNGVVLKTMGKPAWVFRLALLDAVANIVTFLICVRWGIVAVAIGLVVCSYALVPFRLWLLPRLIPLKVTRFFLGLVPATIATAAMALAIVLGRFFVGEAFSAPTRLLTFVVLGAVTYVGVVMTIAPSLYGRVLAVARATFAPAMNHASVGGG